jgi:hypothetical protein
LFEFFPTRFEHLVVSRFLNPVNYAMLTDRFFLLGTRTRHAVTLGAGDHTPLFS